MHKASIAIVLLLAATPLAEAQPGVLTKEQLIEYTPDWKGERFADGRPKVPDAILDRMKSVTLEEAWAVVTGAGFSHQYEDHWVSIHPGQVLVGRALTSQWLPGRPDILRVIEDKGRQQGRVGGTNAWPVDMLQPRDVYVSDHFGLKENGASVGDNVGSAIYAKSGNGIVYDGAVRDINGLREMEQFTSFVRSYDPSHHIGNASAGARLNSTMIGINIPIRIGGAFVMPGDVVLGRDGGVIFIPPQLAEQVGVRQRSRDCATNSDMPACVLASIPPARSTAGGPTRSKRTSPSGCARTSIGCRWRERKSKKS